MSLHLKDVFCLMRLKELTTSHRGIVWGCPDRGPATHMQMHGLRFLSCGTVGCPKDLSATVATYAAAEKPRKKTPCTCIGAPKLLCHHPSQRPVPQTENHWSLICDRSVQQPCSGCSGVNFTAHLCANSIFCRYRNGPLMGHILLCGTLFLVWRKS